MISVGHLVQGRFDKGAFETACQQLLDRHPALRTRFAINAGAVEAIVEQSPASRIDIAVLADPTFKAFRTWALPLVFEKVDPLESGSLVRFIAADYGDSWRFTIAGHHAVSDGFSRGVMNRELLQLYSGEALQPATSFYNTDIDSASPPVQHNVQDVLDTLPVRSQVFAGGQLAQQDELPGTFVERDFDNLSKSIRSLAKATGATRFNVLSSVYALGLSGIFETHDLSTFFQSEGRKVCGASTSVVGPFSNTLPLDLRHDPDVCFADLARGLGDRTSRALACETGPVMEALVAAQKAPTVSLNMFPPAPRIKLNGMSVGPREFLDRRTEYDLNLVWSEDLGVLTARAFYNPNRISKERVDLFITMQERLIQAALSDPTRTCRELLTRVRAEDPAALSSQDVSAASFSRLHELVFDQAEKNPHSIAIQTSERSVTYKALMDESLAYCSALVRAGVGEGDCVAIVASRTPALVAAMLGASASGATFAVLDAAYPATRLSKMIEAVEAKHLINVSSADVEPALTHIQVVLPEHAYERCDVRTGPPRDCAYHLFTSGTTSTPKRISHPEQTLQRFVRWQSQTLGLARPTTLMMAGLSHDPVMRDIFLPLSMGGKVVIPTDAQIFEPCTLRTLATDNEVNVLHVTPSAGRLMAIGESQWRADSVDAVFWGGERLTKNSVDTWQGLAPNAVQYNLYGASETPQAALIHQIGSVAREHFIPLGRPMPWTGTRIVDQNGATLARGETGEIVIDLADPIRCHTGDHPDSEIDLQLHYHTGDRGYVCEDGMVRFLSRQDRQLKINGYRIEPAEIESAALKHNSISSACLLSSSRSSDEVCLYVESGDESLQTPSLRTYLSSLLPAYMIPQQIEVLAQMPLTQNGKVDHAELRARSPAPSPIDQAQTLPLETEAENQIAKIFQKFSGQDVYGAHQSLVDIGADSLSLLETRFAFEDEGYDLPEDWEFLSIRDLTNFQTRRQSERDNFGWLRSLHRLDTFIVLRCAAILAIVTYHAGIDVPEGASILLFALTGFALGRLQLPAILNDRKIGRIWSMIAKLLIPLIPVSIILYLVHAYIGNNPHISTLLFYENVSAFIDTLILGQENTQQHSVWLWFLHVYLQIFLIIGVVLSIPKVFDWLRVDPWRTAVAFFVISNAMLVVSLIWISQIEAEYSEAAPLFARSPIAVLPFIAAGVLFSAADTKARKTIGVTLAALMLIAYSSLYGIHTETIWFFGLVLCVVLPQMRIPHLFSLIVASVSTQALMIYLSHRMTLFGIETLFLDRIPALIEIAIAVAVGVGFGRAMRPFLQALGINRLAQLQMPFSAHGTTVAHRS